VEDDVAVPHASARAARKSVIPALTLETLATAAEAGVGRGISGDFVLKNRLPTPPRRGRI
jgi:hypothetical protein